MNYRADIDGLRAVAVTLVILFHYGFPGVTGGYIGVDVFFVLSGYLIGSIVFAALRRGDFDFIKFYFRRIRRLFPAYIFMMVVTFVLAYLLMLPQDFREFGQSLFASTVYVSNILFYWEAGYFDTAAHLKPLLHTWSLSVEEQFYIFFPIIAWVIAKYSPDKNRAIFLALLVASLAAAIVWLPFDNSAVFYLYPFRAWELFVGTVIALGMAPTLVSRNAANLVAIIGAMLIVGPAFAYDSATVFPGLTALAPCLGTVLLIQSCNVKSNWVGAALRLAPVVYVGKISYSLYLWHWPLYVLFAYSKPEGMTAFDTAAVAGATILLSVLSYKYIECPIRQGSFEFSKRYVPVFSSAAIASVGFLAIGYFIHITNGMPSRLSPNTAAFAQAAGDLFGDTSNCSSWDNSVFPDIEYCTVGDPFNDQSYTLIWGDSHGGAYRRGFASLMDESNHSALIAWTGGCPPVFGLEKDESVSSQPVDARCYQRNEAVRDLLETDSRIDSIILVGRWSYYLNGSGVGLDDHNKIRIWPHGADEDSATDQAQYFKDEFAATLAALNAFNRKVFVVEQPPEFSRYHARLLAVRMMRGAVDISEAIQEFATESYNNVLERQGNMATVLNDAEHKAQASILRTHHYFCAESVCSVMLGDAPAYFDNNHVSSSGAVQIRQMFDPVRVHLDQYVSDSMQAVSAYRDTASN